MKIQTKAKTTNYNVPLDPLKATFTDLGSGIYAIWYLIRKSLRNVMFFGFGLGFVSSIAVTYINMCI